MQACLRASCSLPHMYMYCLSCLPYTVTPAVLSACTACLYRLLVPPACSAYLYCPACTACLRSASKSGGFAPLPYRRETAILVCALVMSGLVSYSRHCNWVTSEAYSSPSIVLISGWGPYRWASVCIVLYFTVLYCTLLHYSSAASCSYEAGDHTGGQCW